MTAENDNELFRKLMDLTKQMQRYGFATRGTQRGRHHGFGRGRLLQLIADHDNVTQSELAELLDVRPSSLSEMLSKLAEHDLIERHPDDNDKRVTHVVLTEAGRKRLAERKQATNDYLAGMFEGLSDDEKAQLQNLINKLNGSLKDKLTEMEETSGENTDDVFGPFAGGRGHFGRHGFGGHDGFDPRQHGFDRRHHDGRDEMGTMGGFWG